MNKKILITGTRSGLGKFLSEKYEDSICITRKTPLNDNIIYENIDTIIHCAFNQNISELNLINYKIYEDNINLTKKLLKIPHRRFVYISTSQISELNSNFQPSPYVVLKALNEHIVREQSKTYLILRPSCLIGDGMRKNSVYKLMNNENITLTEDSVNDFILFDDVYDAIESYKSGIFYLLSNKKAIMKEIAEIFNKKINFGDFKYNINVESDINIGRTSFEVLKEYFGEIE